MSRKPYDSDLTDEQWDQLREFIPDPKPGPQESKYERREIVNAFLYQKRTGCQWRYLPHDFPPWQIVAKYFGCSSHRDGRLRSLRGGSGVMSTTLASTETSQWYVVATRAHASS